MIQTYNFALVSVWWILPTNFGGGVDEKASGAEPKSTTFSCFSLKAHDWNNQCDSLKVAHVYKSRRWT